MFIVYKVTNKINGKGYIGFTGRTFEQRWWSHLSSVRQGSNYRFHSAIRKYGVDGFTNEILFTTDDIMEARTTEEKLIIEHNTMNYGYNAKPGGCGGWIVPPEKYDQRRKKLSVINTGEGNANSLKITNDEILELTRKYTKEKDMIPSHSKLIEYGKEFGIKIPSTFGNKYRNGGFEYFQNIVEKETGLKYNPYYRSPEQRERARQFNTGRKLSENHKRNIQIGMGRNPKC